jgi:pimeloyl-ACP methyl ester carboxylesterase
MAGYVEVNGVNTWYDDRGEGDPLVLLHGGLTDGRDFTGNLDALAERFRVLLPERRGHGHTADMPGPITVEAMAQDTIAFVEEIVRGPVRLVGYSAGAIVALRVAVRRLDLVDRLVLISGAFHPDGLILRPTADAPPPAPLLAGYAEVSPDGPDHLPVVIAKIARSAAQEPGLEPGELHTVTCPALVVAADDDIVTLEHTLELYRNLRGGQLAVVPGTSHLLLQEKPGPCTGLVTDFLTTDPAVTRMPIRRASPTSGSTAPVTAAQPHRHHPGQQNLPTGLSKPAQRALDAAGYTSLERLAEVSEADLARLHGIGPKAIEQLRQALAAAGLSFSETN